LKKKKRQEEFRALREKWILSSDGFIIVYSITSRESFEFIDNFLNQITKTIDKDKSKLALTLVGNKSDLSNKRQVATTEGEEKAKEIGPEVRFVETSAKERTNIDEPIMELIRAIRKNKPVKPKSKFNCYIL
jgi:GTPase SAR1 family protein